MEKLLVEQIVVWFANRDMPLICKMKSPLLLSVSAYDEERNVLNKHQESVKMKITASLRR